MTWTLTLRSPAAKGFHHLSSSIALKHHEIFILRGSGYWPMRYMHALLKLVQLAQCLKPNSDQSKNCVPRF